MNTPTTEQVAAHFKNAKTIKCLNLKTFIDISYVDKFIYHEKANKYTTTSPLVVVWNAKEGYAAITKVKCAPGKCKNCEKCNDKKL